MIHKIFEGQVEEVSDRVAVVYEDRQITYGELNRRSNQLAHYLVARGVSKGKLVGVLLNRDLELVITILAILKIGGVYMPLDMGYPESRLKYIYNDSNIRTLITKGVKEIDLVCVIVK